MNWDVAIRIFIPIGTFLLGVFSTWLFKRAEDRRFLVRRHAEEITRLANEWYNQLHEIRYFSNTGDKNRELRQKIDAYIHNRLILPQVLLSLGVLKDFPEASALVREAEGFLSLVTAYREGEKPNLSCVFCYDPAAVRSTEQGSRLEELLADLDRRLQMISRLSAALLTGRLVPAEVRPSSGTLLLGSGEAEAGRIGGAPVLTTSRNRENHAI